jgi:hypothetical protein
MQALPTHGLELLYFTDFVAEIMDIVRTRAIKRFGREPFGAVENSRRRADRTAPVKHAEFK